MLIINACAGTQQTATGDLALGTFTNRPKAAQSSSYMYTLWQTHPPITQGTCLWSLWS